MIFFVAKNTFFGSGVIFAKMKIIMAVSKITKNDTNVPTIMFVKRDFLVTYPKSAENGPSKLFF